MVSGKMLGAGKRDGYGGLRPLSFFSKKSMLPKEAVSEVNFSPRRRQGFARCAKDLIMYIP